MSRAEIIVLLESLRLPEEAMKDTGALARTTNGTITEDRNPFLNDPALYSNKVPYLLYDRNNETVITRTTKGINEGKLNPFEINWMEVTLYETEFVRDVLERLDSIFMKDVAQAIDDEDVRHAHEDGQYTLIVSNSFGTGKGNSNQYSYTRDNWSNGDNCLSAMTIAEGILDKRNKAEEYRKKMEQQKRTDNTDEERNTKSVFPEFDADTEILLQQIAELKAQVNQLVHENVTLKQQLEDKEPEKAFNATGNECFTKAKMGLLIYTIASLKDGPTPIKAQLVSIISAIGGWEPTSVGTEMKKAGFNKNDIDAVAKLFENVMPNFASEIKKQIPRRPKTKK